MITIGLCIKGRGSLYYITKAVKREIAKTIEKHFIKSHPNDNKNPKNTDPLNHFT